LDLKQVEKYRDNQNTQFAEQGYISLTENKKVCNLPSSLASVGVPDLIGFGLRVRVVWTRDLVGCAVRLASAAKSAFLQ